MFNFVKKSDTELQRDVMSELVWEPSVTSDDLSVMAADGVVTLRGNVPHYSEKLAAEKAAQRVSGVRAVADEIVVQFRISSDRTDQEIAKSALVALELSCSVPIGLKVLVEKGWITLTGEVEWDFQRSAAKDAVGQLKGVTGVSNNITLKAQKQSADIKARIEAAIQRTAAKNRNLKVRI